MRQKNKKTISPRVDEMSFSEVSVSVRCFRKMTLGQNKLNSAKDKNNIPPQKYCHGNVNMPKQRKLFFVKAE